MRLEEKRRIRRPRQKVFTYTSDFSRIAEWDPGVVRSRRIGEGPIGVGARFEVEAKLGPGTTPMVYEIVTYQPDERVVLDGRGERLDALDEISFSAEGEETVVSYVADLSFKGFLGLLAPLMAPAIRRAGERAVDGLVATLEK